MTLFSFLKTISKILKCILVTQRKCPFPLSQWKQQKTPKTKIVVECRKPDSPYLYENTNSFQNNQTLCILTNSFYKTFSEEFESRVQEYNKGRKKRNYPPA